MEMRPCPRASEETCTSLSSGPMVRVQTEETRPGSQPLPQTRRWSGTGTCVQKRPVLPAGLLIHPWFSTSTLAFGSRLNLLCLFIIYLFICLN